jgi:hypothetical protein
LTRARARWLWPLALGVAVAGAEAPGLAPSLLDARADAVAARTAVPNEARKQGEVRLVTRGDATVVQTLLASKILPRVVAEIRKKEARNWPAGRPGRADMERHRAAIERAAGALAARRDAVGEGGDRWLRLAIELVATRDAAGLVLAEFTGGEVDGQLEPGDRRVIEALPLGRGYVVRNMRLVLADAFGLPDDELSRLGPLGPLADAPAAR